MPLNKSCDGFAWGWWGARCIWDRLAIHRPQTECTQFPEHWQQNCWAYEQWYMGCNGKAFKNILGLAAARRNQDRWQVVLTVFGGKSLGSLDPYVLLCPRTIPVANNPASITLGPQLTPWHVSSVSLVKRCLLMCTAHAHLHQAISTTDAGSHTGLCEVKPGGTSRK